ncbi:MAG: ice-binding family protein [Anaerolineae bacterium]
MKRTDYLILVLALAMVLSAASLSEAVSANFAAPSSERAVRPAAVAPTLGTASSFGVLGGSTVTNTGPTVITGDLGVYPGLSITGFDGAPDGTVTGTIYAGGDVALGAQTDVTTAFNDLAGQACNTNLTDQDLGGMTLTPGVYCFSSSAQLTGALTLNAVGDPGAVFVFQIGSTLTTASNSSVVMTNGGNQCNVYWQVGSSATLGTGTAFAGNIFAGASITLTTDADVIGRALAREGAVTMDTNNVSYDLCSSAAITPTATVEIPTATVENPTVTVEIPTATNPPPAAPTSAPVAAPATEMPTAVALTPTAEAAQSSLPTAGVAGAQGGNLSGLLAGAAVGVSAVMIWLRNRRRA